MAGCSIEGLKLEGLMYSPGGELLPHPCEPFHATNNNPYAVKCVDAWPWYNSGFPGDQYCVLPPEPGKGMQIGVHPQGPDWYGQVSQGDMSGYQGVDRQYIVKAGGEEEMTYYTEVVTPTEQKFYRSYTRMRAGSHHMIVSAMNKPNLAGTWGPANAGEALDAPRLPSAQRVDENQPATLAKPAEDQGLYAVVAAGTQVAFNMHHFNVTDGDVLKEAWINVWFEEDATVPLLDIFSLGNDQLLFGFAQPGETVDMHYSIPIAQETRLVALLGHRHAWTTNFSAWLEKPGGEREVLYQSFNFYDAPTYRYDSFAENPMPSAERRQDGATSGVRVLHPGEVLHYNCHIAFTEERAAKVDAPMPSTIGPLRFANQAFNAEMCVLFGYTAARRLPEPVRETAPPPDFATTE